MDETVGTRRIVAGVTMAGGAALAVGALLPWLSLYAGLDTLRGTGALNGRLLFAGGVVAVGIGAWFMARGGTGLRWAIGGLGLAASAFTAWLVVQLLASYRELAADPFVFARLGPGLFVSALGGVMVLATLAIGRAATPGDGRVMKSPAASAEAETVPVVRSGGLVSGLALLSAGAGAIHLAVMGEHAREWWLFGLFFAASGAAQLVWAVVVASRGTRSLLVAGAIGNAAIVALWAASRLVGVPVGPHAGTPEAVGLADVVATAYEALVVIGATWLLLRRSSRPALRASFARVGGWAFGAAVVGLGLVATLAGVGIRL